MTFIFSKPKIYCIWGKKYVNLSRNISIATFKKQKQKVARTSFVKFAGEILFKEEMRRRDWVFLKVDMQLS